MNKKVKKSPKKKKKRKGQVDFGYYGEGKTRKKTRKK